MTEIRDGKNAIVFYDWMLKDRNGKILSIYYATVNGQLWYVDHFDRGLPQPRVEFPMAVRS